MKRHGFLFEKAFTREALLNAFHAAARHKRGKRACFQFEKHLSSNLDALFDELHSGRYQPRPYFSFMVYEPKPRRIFAPAFRDLVVQHAIYAVIEPIFDPGFIRQSFACRKGYGTHAAAYYTQAALRKCKPDEYTLKLDVRKFFYRIDRNVLHELLAARIKDRRFLSLMMLFADHGEPIGIPIGNLLSQIYALIYLNPIDHFIKRELGVKKYARYVDDLVLFGLTHDQAIEYRQRIEAQLAELQLSLSRSTVAKVKRGINFVGYRTWQRTRFIRKHSLFTFRRRAIAGRLDSIVSALGHARHTASYAHLLSTLKRNHHGLYRQLPKTHHHRNHPRIASAGRRRAA